MTVNGANDTFTITNAGRYLVSYRINSTAAVLASSRVLINGSPSTPLTISPVLSVSSYSADAIVTLTAGSTLTLQLFGLLGAVTLLSSSQGAELTIIRLS